MEVIFANAAFRHGYTRQDFYELFAAEYLKIRGQRGLDDVYELLGRNLSVYRVLRDNRLKVFHMNGMSETRKNATGGFGSEKGKAKN